MYPAINNLTYLQLLCWHSILFFDRIGLLWYQICMFTLVLWYASWCCWTLRPTLGLTVVLQAPSFAMTCSCLLRQCLSCVKDLRSSSYQSSTFFLNLTSRYPALTLWRTRYRLLLLPILFLENISDWISCGSLFSHCERTFNFLSENYSRLHGTYLPLGTERLLPHVFLFVAAWGMFAMGVCHPGN